MPRHGSAGTAQLAGFLAFDRWFGEVWQPRYTVRRPRPGWRLADRSEVGLPHLFVFLVFAGYLVGVVTTGSDLLTTGSVARLLGTSRQQVVNLCERGDLPFVMVGKHRRVERGAVEALLRPKQRLTRDQLKSLWLHQAVAGSLVSDPDSVLGKAAENLDRLLVLHQGTMTEVWLMRWREKLRQGPGAVLKVLTSEDPEAVELRQNSPFAGVLSQSQRRQVLDAFTRSGWEHAA